MIGEKIKNLDKEAGEVLQNCIKYGETIEVDTTTAIERYIKAREGEIFQEKERIRKAKLKIEKIERVKILAEKALTNFWIKEIGKRKIK